MAEASRADELDDLFRDQYPALVRLAVAMTGDRDTAEDLAQEAFARAWPRIPRLRDPSAAPLYLRRTLINLARRGYQRRALDVRARLHRADPTSDRDVVETMTVVAALQLLPARQRACVVLRFYEDLTEQATAQVLGVSVGTVKSQVHKALKRLEPILGEGR